MNITDKKQAKLASRLQKRQARLNGEQAVTDTLEQSAMRATARAIAMELYGVETATSNTETLFLSIAERMPVMTTAHDDDTYVKACRDAIKPLREAVFASLCEQQGIVIPKRVAKPNAEQKQAADDFRKLKNGKLKMLDNARADIITVYTWGLENEAADAMLAGENARSVFTGIAKRVREASKGVGDLTAEQAEKLAPDVWESLHRALRMLDTLNLDSADASKFISLCKQHAKDSPFPSVSVKALDECTADELDEAA